MMIFDSLDSHRLKRPVTDVQGDLDDFDAAIAEAIQQLRGEVQASGRGRYCATFAREDGLIPLGIQSVFFVSFDIRRQRGAADPIYDFVEVARCLEADDSAPPFAPLDHFSRKLASGELNAGTRHQRSSRLYKCFPYEWFDAADKKDLDAPAEHRLTSRSHPQATAYKPCRKYSSIVQHEQVTRSKMIRQRCENRIREVAACPVNDQQTGTLALSRRLLCDQLFWKNVIKIGDSHSFTDKPGAGGH
jgi:hypothetical protein